MSLAALALSVSTGPGAAAADAKTVLWMSGTGGAIEHFLPRDLFGTPGTFLGGAYGQDTFTVVDYPSSIWPLTGPTDPLLGHSIEAGAANLVAAALSTSDDLVIAGVSQGAMVVQQAQALLDSDPTVPSSTTFIIIADPNLGLVSGYYGRSVPVFHYVPQPLAETRFNTIIVINQYDGFAQSVRQPTNLVAALNAMMGMAFVHPFAQSSDLSAVPAQNITTTVNDRGGTTTTFVVPTERLPLTQPLRTAGFPDVAVDALDDVLRPVIDAAYEPPSRRASAADSAKRVSRQPASSATKSSRPGEPDQRRSGSRARANA